MARKKGAHYVDNAKFLQAMKDWKEQCKDAEEAGDENPEKSKNPFAYFTQIIYYAFIRRIQKEKKQTHVKHKMIEKQEYIPFTTMEGDDTPYSIGGFDATTMLPDEAVYKPKKKESTEKIEGLENFMEPNE